MAIKNYFSDYADFISTYQNMIMKIQLRYNECQSWVSLGYEQGLLSKEDYDKLNDCRMDELFTGYDLKYVLSAEEVAVIREYADLDNEGKVLSTFLKPKYLRKNELLQGIFQSVRMFAYYDRLDYRTKRQTFKEVVLKFYLEEKSKCIDELNKLENVYGQKKFTSSKYKELTVELERINAAIRYADSILKMDDEALNKAISSFYRIKFQYYEWYNRMRLQEEYLSGNVYEEHSGTMERLQSDFNNSLALRSTMNDEYNEAYGISRDLSKFLEGIINFDVEDLEIETTKKGFLGKLKSATDNKDILLNVFKELYKLHGVMFYLENNFEIEEDGKLLDISNIFELYYKKIYGDVTYVDVDSFVNKFRKVVTAYYKRVLAEYDKLMKKRGKSLTDIDSSLVSNIDRGLVQAKLINEIYKGYNGSGSVSLAGFNEQELNDMYNSLKTYITNGFSFLEPEIVKKKV